MRFYTHHFSIKIFTESIIKARIKLIFCRNRFQDIKLKCHASTNKRKINSLLILEVSYESCVLPNSRSDHTYYLIEYRTYYQQPFSSRTTVQVRVSFVDVSSIYSQNIPTAEPHSTRIGVQLVNFDYLYRLG